MSHGPGRLELFPPAPRGLKGRTRELATLARAIELTAPARVALVGAGGSGKSMLAAALGHRLAPRFGGRLHWFRTAAWDFRTLAEMLALRFGTTRAPRQLVGGLTRFLSRQDRLIVLDNHEDDRAMARLLQELSGTRATFLLTARRCLLSGVLVYPVTAPLVTGGGSAFPRVAPLTRALRWSPLALDIADAIVSSGACTVQALATYLRRAGVEAIAAMDHEDDVPEVARLVDWAWRRLPGASRRILGVLAHVEGDHVDLGSLGVLARVRRPAEAVAALTSWHLVQEPLCARYTLHAVVRHAIRRRTEGDPRRVFRHYLTLLEQHPDRLVVEQTHLFAAMDHVHREGDLDGMLAVERLLRRLEATSGAA